METKMIGNKIAEARKKINISQSELAQRLFISAQAVGKWERGESMPDIITFNRLAELLGVDLNYFSESFSSAEIPAAPLVQQVAELPASKQKDKLSWDMSRGSWVDADFSGLKNLKEKFSASGMKNCLFVGSEMSGLILEDNYVNDCDFSGSDISGSHIKNSYMMNNLFKDCSLKDAAFSESYIKNDNFTAADFTGALIKSSVFHKNIVDHALFNRTSFKDSDISDIVFVGTLEDCYFESCSFKKVTFQNATLLNTFFKCKSLKQLRFINCQADRMTYEFLKNGKADLSGITLLTS